MIKVDSFEDVVAQVHFPGLDDGFLGSEWDDDGTGPAELVRQGVEVADWGADDAGGGPQ